MVKPTIWCNLTLILTACVPARAQEKGPTIPVPDTNRAEGVPPIPASVSQALNRYQNIRSASFQDWASDGSGMYVITRFADVPQVHFVTSPGGARTQLTFLNERVRSVSARPKHDQFLYTADEGGAENYQLFLQDRKGGEARRITDGKSRNMAPKWSPSGSLLAWSSNARNGRDMDLYVAAPTDSHFVRRLKEVSGQWTVSDWSPDETRVAVVEYISINESYIHILEVATGKTEILTPRPSDPRQERAFAGDAKWSKDGKAIYYITDRDSEFRTLVRHELDSDKAVPLSGRIRSDIEEFDLSDDGNYLAWVANVDGVSQLGIGPSDEELPVPVQLVPEQAGATVSGLPTTGIPVGPSGRPAQILSLPAPGIISGIAFGPRSQRVAFTLSSSRNTSDSYVWIPIGEENSPWHIRWTSSETGGLDPSTFAEPQRIEYRSFDDRKIPAFVYRPSAQRFPGLRPVLIDIHGGPEGQFRPRFIGRLNYLVDELGLVLIRPNVRGSTGYGKTYSKLDNGKLRADAVKDIGALLDWIAQQRDLDKSRVGVTGSSYGGFMSLAVQTTYNDRIRAGIDIIGISNLVSFLENTQGYRRDLRRAEYGDERDPAMRSFLERISPLSSAAKIRTPILIVMGQNDPRVPISEAEQMVAALKKNKVPVWYVVGKNEGHGFAKKTNQDYLQAVEVEFLRRYLLGGGERQAAELPERFPVSGMVRFNGEPLAAGTNVFHPVGADGHLARGVIRDGRFRMTTVNSDDGAVPGDYKVAIESQGDDSDTIPAKYANPETTGLKCHISRARGTVLDFHLAE
jgi:dipeptidyl aminopeptidase/acylaminoacyl peptidase